MTVLDHIFTTDDGEQEGRTDGGTAVSAEADGAVEDDRLARESDAGAEVPTPGDEVETVDLDRVFGILQNERRRRVLQHLETLGDEEIAIGDLAERIAATECGKDPRQITSKERKRVYVGLYQCHLPKMADAGAIAYNKPRGRISRGETFEQYTVYLDTGDTEEGQQGGFEVLDRVVSRLGD